jgi:hypothetical protein
VGVKRPRSIFYFAWSNEGRKKKRSRTKWIVGQHLGAENKNKKQNMAQCSRPHSTPTMVRTLISCFFFLRYIAQLLKQDDRGNNSCICMLVSMNKERHRRKMGNLTTTENVPPLLYQ